MPELPEVETTVRGLNNTVIGRTIIGYWTDWPKYIKIPKNNAVFRRRVHNQKIIGVKRLGKNILIYLQNGCVLLIHQKMSGHLMFGRWIKNAKPKPTGGIWAGQKWLPQKTGTFSESKNRFIRLIFFFKDGSMLALSDLRRFAKIICAPQAAVLNLSEIKKLGPDPTRDNFTFSEFNQILNSRNGAIKKILLDQNMISGIGNIYADEILHLSKIHPLKQTRKLTVPEKQKIFRAAKKILASAVKFGGTSMDDYRNVFGAKGNYEKHLRAYHRTGQKCYRCGAPIERIKIGGRSSHFCSQCQKP